MSTRSMVAEYKASLVRYLDRHWGLAPTTPDACPVLTHTFTTDLQRHDAWLADTLHTAWRDFEAGEVKYAWRGLLMAREYLGKRGGFWPTSDIHDSYTALQNDLERVVFA